MKEKKFLDTTSDDLIMLEDAYMTYIKKYQNIPPLWIWSSLCRVYTMVAVSTIEYFIEYAQDKAKMKKEKEWRKKVEEIVKKALDRSDVPNESMIPEKIDNFVYLRELRHYITHTGVNVKTESMVKKLGLSLDIEKYGEKEFKIIKQAVGDIINLIGMSYCLI